MVLNWMYNGREINTIEDFEDDIAGFIYEIEFNNGKRYIGKKSLYHTRTLKPLKGTRKKRKKVVESDWATYQGSFKDKELKELLKNGHLVPVRRNIIHLCKDKWEMTYYETKYLFQHNCLLSDEFYNNNILGKFYRPKEQV